MVHILLSPNTTPNKNSKKNENSCFRHKKQLLSKVQNTSNYKNKHELPMYVISLLPL